MISKNKLFTDFGSVPEPRNSTILVQITASSSQLWLPNSFGGGLFSFLEQKSASKALKTRYFAYFSGQWGARAPSPGYATDCSVVSQVTLAWRQQRQRRNLCSLRDKLPPASAICLPHTDRSFMLSLYVKQRTYEYQFFNF